MKRGKNVKRKTARHKMSVQLTVKSSLYNSGKVTKVLKCTNTSTSFKIPCLVQAGNPESYYDKDSELGLLFHQQHF